MPQTLRALVYLFLVGALVGVEQASCAVSREEYLAYCKAAAEESWQTLDAQHEQWRRSIDVEYVFGYNPPANDVYLAALYANLYELEGNQEYLERARGLLVKYGEYKKAYPADYVKSRPEFARGLPALPNIFSFPKYLRAYDVLKRTGKLSPSDRATIERNIAESADFMIAFQEWGPMNRALLRAECLAYAAKVAPDHPRASTWKMMAAAIGEDSWGQWEIEDATGYHGIWLYALLGYASDALGDESVYRTAVMHYYFDYYLALVSPAGVIPDFGDAYWGGGWDRMVPFFEKGAAVYHDGRLRWAAEQAFRKYLDPLPERKSPFLALVMSDAARWADFSVDAVQPTSGSQQVLEDQVGKKVVFRNGWEKQSTYMLYNYRDEGDGGWLFRQNLRTSIPVEEEKMHHGHSDENSIVLLMKNQNILLHDGGYRDFMPSGPYGAFRADYFHNRLAVREGKIALGQKEGQYRYATEKHAAVEGQSMLDFFRNSGAYRQVRTQKVDFLVLEDFDMTRTRVIDADLGYEADRIITYVKPLDWFVVFDIVRFTRPGYLTMATLWHTRLVHASGEGWYETSYDSLRTVDVSGNERLLIHFPVRAQLEEGVESQMRYWQKEQAVYQLIGRHGNLNDLQAFVTVLIPHEKSVKPESLLGRVRVLDIPEYPAAVGIQLLDGGKTYTIGAKLDLQRELVYDWKRPMYDYDSGKIRYGDFETDGYNLFVVEDATTIDYTMVGGVKITRLGRTLHEQPPILSGLRFDGSPDGEGVGKLRYWRERVTKDVTPSKTR
jgi:hypothetical protein